MKAESIKPAKANEQHVMGALIAQRDNFLNHNANLQARLTAAEEEIAALRQCDGHDDSAAEAGLSPTPA